MRIFISSMQKELELERAAAAGLPGLNLVRAVHNRPIIVRQFDQIVRFGPLHALRSSRAAEKPEPSFRWDNGLWVEFSWQEAETPVKTPGQTGEASGVTPPVPAQVAAQVTDVGNAQWDRVLGDITRVFPSATAQVTGQVAGQVAAWVCRALLACKEGPKRSSEIQAVTGFRHRETFQRNYLDVLLAENWLERTIPERPKSRLQKYRLTAKGAALLAGMEKL